MAKSKPLPNFVAAQQLRVGYYGEPVCYPIDFTLKRGQSLGLIGANGAGKSTVLRAVLGQLEPIDGELKVFGRKVDEREAAFRAGVAGVMDDDAFFPGLTVLEHLSLVAAGHGAEDPAAAVAAELHRFGIENIADALPTALSSGQRRRVLLAAAFVRPARLMVLDEPEQRLDQAMRARLAEALVERARAGTSILLATHDGDLLMGLRSKALLVSDGEAQPLTAKEAAAMMETW